MKIFPYWENITPVKRGNIASFKIRTNAEKTQRAAIVKEFRIEHILSKKRKLLNKTEGRCCYCGKDVTGLNFSIEHVCPKAVGGKNSIDNLMPACIKCNTTRNNDILAADYAVLKGFVVYVDVLAAMDRPKVAK